MGIGGLGWLGLRQNDGMRQKPAIKLQQHAFVRGFWCGLASPLTLYTSKVLPAELQDYDFKPLPPMNRGSLRGDWQRVGDALRSASERAVNG